MTENGKRLLTLKGVVVEEEPEPKVDSAQILKQYREKKASQQNPDKWDDLDTVWNTDDTLNRLTLFKDGEVLYEYDFAWNSNGSLSKIMRRT